MHHEEEKKTEPCETLQNIQISLHTPAAAAEPSNYSQMVIELFVCHLSSP
jgi:hypothetical protein